MKKVLSLFMIVVFAGYAHAALADGNLGLAQLSVSLSVGQTTTINASGGYLLAIGNNSSPTVATASITGSYNQVTINAIAIGTTNIQICNSNNLCDTIVVTVGAVQSTPISLSQTNVTLSPAQNQTIAISGLNSGGYAVANNSNPSSVQAYINGASLVVTGGSYGGSNISVCQSDGQCASVYVFVNGNPPSTIPTVLAPILNSVSISSSASNAVFLGAGSTINVSFNTTGPILNPYITVGPARAAAFGSGNTGPYTATYTATGNEGAQTPITINFTDSAGRQTQATFVNGGPSVSTQPAVAAAPSIVSSNSDGYVFAKPLAVGATGSEVTELQKRLTVDGSYTGPINGSFGPLTEAAVKKFQTKHSLSPLGSVGPGTRTALNNIK